MSTTDIATTPIDGKLSKLIPLLGSDKDGEVIAAARAIGRTLQAAGKDWFDVARAIAIAPQPDLSDPRAVASWLLQSGRCRPHEADFLRNVRRGIRLTEKQLEWLDGILARARS